MIFIGMALFTAFSVVAMTPEFKNYTRVEAGGSLIDVFFGRTSPCVSDWNGDGKQDLLIGHCEPKPKGNGNLRFYENISTGDTPEFATFDQLKVGEVNITIPYD